MLKKIFSALTVFSLALGILSVSLYRVTSHVRPSFAVSSIKFSVSPAPEATSSTQAIPSPTPTVNYYLPYPGILPDHSFYKIKMIRDQIWLALTNDPVQKAQLLLLFADKRIGAGDVLIRGNKVDLGISTFIKGEKYLEKAISEVAKAKEKGLNVGDVSVKLKTAPLKYEEVLINLKQSVSPDNQSALEDLLKFTKNLREKASTL